MAATPTPVVGQQRYNQVKDILMRSQDRIAAILPKHITPERMIRVALTTIQSNPRILLCSPLSIVGTIVQASELGLELNGFLGEAYIVPYWNTRTGALEAQFQAGYRGLISLARRSGLVSIIKPVLVYHFDTFKIYEGSSPRIEHEPDYDHEDRGLVDSNGNMVGLRGAYATVLYKDGTQDFEYLPLTRLDELRDRSKARDKDNNEVGPWTTDPGEMYRKVPIRQIAKRLPLSPEFQKAAVLDEYGEAGIRQNLGAIIESDTNFSNVMADIAAIRTEELANKYTSGRSTQQPPQQQYPHQQQEQQQQQHPQQQQRPIQPNYDRPVTHSAPQQPQTPFRPSGANVSYGEQFSRPNAAPARRRSR